MFRIVKRDGEQVDFRLDKISGAIIKAFDATRVQYNQDIIDLLALRVTADMQTKVKEGLIQVEEIQDSVEKVLEQAGYAEAAKAFILYRKQREKMRNMKLLADTQHSVVPLVALTHGDQHITAGIHTGNRAGEQLLSLVGIALVDHAR